MLPRLVLVLGLGGVVAVLGLWIAGVIHAPGTVHPAASRGKSLLLITVEDLRADHLHGLGYPRRTTPELFAMAARGAAVRWGWIPSPDPAECLEAILRARPPGDFGGAAAAGAAAVGGALAGRIASGTACAAFLQGAGAVEVARRVGIPSVQAFDTAGEARASAAHWMRRHGDQPFTAWLHLQVPRHRDPSRPSLFAAGRSDPAARVEGDYDDRLRELDGNFRDLRHALEGGALLESTLVVIAGVSAPVFDHEKPLGPGEGEGLDPARHRVVVVYARWNGIAEFTSVEGNFDALDTLPTALALLGEAVPPSARGISRAREVRRGGRLAGGGASRADGEDSGEGQEAEPPEGPGAQANPGGLGSDVALWGARRAGGRRPVGLLRGDLLAVRTAGGRLRVYRVTGTGRGAKALAGEVPAGLRHALEERFPSR